MTTGKYDELDRAILSFIGDTKAATGRNGVKATAGEMMQHQPILQETVLLSIEMGDVFSRDFKQPFRFLDGRLQALKRAGKIRFIGPGAGWAPVEKAKL
jgi:hypothetical protein